MSLRMRTTCSFESYSIDFSLMTFLMKRPAMTE